MSFLTNIMPTISFAPLLPWTFIWFLIALICLIVIYGFIRAPRGGIFRLIAATALLALLTGPSVLHETRSGLPDIAIIIEDNSASQKLDDRAEITAAAVTTLEERLDSFENLEVRTVSVTGTEETRIGEALSFALGDVPRNQLSGIFILSDGQASDAPESAEALDIKSPVHFFMTGREDEIDRRIEIISAPRFGIVNENIDVKFRIDDTGSTADTALVVLRLDGDAVVSQVVNVGEDLTLTAPLSRPGETVIEITIEELPNELTTRNNRAAIQITAIRDRLRVLLVSGEPHAGERVWRNLLKSDPAVDLIHFTILKPFEKTAVARPQDLALIQFPEDELFLDKLSEFDVLIFDRYTYRRVLSPLHFENISRYVDQGGAILISAGPEFSGDQSLAAQRNLAYILPATPNGAAIEQAFTPAVSNAGARHPVTSDLTGFSQGNEHDWGRWLRTMPSQTRSGNILMEGASAAPLLVVDRVGQGRVALLLSDHVWLWARGFDGGGPHAELLRRLVHWLMKEPELEEETLTASAAPNDTGGTITLTRRTMLEEIAPITFTAPDGTSEQISLDETAPGTWSRDIPVNEPGLYRAETSAEIIQNTNINTPDAAPETRPLFAVTSLGLTAAPEYDVVTQTDEKFAPLTEATKGGIYALREGANFRLPDIRAVAAGKNARPRNGRSDWAGIYQQNASRLDAVTTKPLAPPLAWLLLIGASLITAWIVEGRGFRKMRKTQKPAKV